MYQHRPRSPADFGNSSMGARVPSCLCGECPKCKARLRQQKYYKGKQKQKNQIFYKQKAKLQKEYVARKKLTDEDWEKKQYLESKISRRRCAIRNMLKRVEEKEIELLSLIRQLDALKAKKSGRPSLSCS